MILLDEKEYLSDTQISRWVDKSEAAYKKAAGKRAADTKKLRITIEEMLIRFRNTYGTAEICRIVVRKSFGRIIFEITQHGESKNCFITDDDLLGSYDILANMGIYPKYAYLSASGGINKASYEYAQKPQKNQMLLKIFAAIILAVLCFFSIQILPDAHKTLVTDILTKQIFRKMCNVLSALATPLVFFAVVVGITGMSDIASFGKIGKTVCIRMLGTYMIAVCIIAAGCALAFPMQTGTSSTQGNALKQVLQMILDIIPDNLINPFAADNDLQVIAIALFTGVTMLVLKDKVQNINALFMEGAELINKMMLIVCQLIPFVVFLGVLNLLCNSKADQLLGLYKMIIVFLPSAFILILITILRTVISMKVPFSVLFKKQIPTLLINITTSSQITALPENMKCCKEKFGIDGKMIDFAIPFGIVTYMPTGAIFFGVTVWGLAFLNNIPVPPLMAIKIMIMSVIVAIAAPPIPGSGIIVLPILFASCGLPTEYMSLGIIFASLAGYILPACNGFLIQLELLMTANKLNMVDKEKLKKKWSD